MNSIDLTGKKLHRLTVLKRTRVHTQPSGNKVQYWETQCECGTVKEVKQHGKKLKARSCGCLSKEKASKRCSTLNLVTDKKQYILDNIKFDRRTGCWNWVGTLWANGYARTGIKGCKGRAYRLAYQEFVGVISKGNIICHRCDNPKCVNPNHLFQGSNQDNMTDMVNKNRSLKGEKHHKAKLTLPQVLEIRSRENEPRVKLAKEFGVSDCTIRDIIKRRSWTHA